MGAESRASKEVSAFPKLGESVKSAARTLEVLELLTSNPRGLTFSAICEEVKLSKSSAHGLLTTMLDRGFLSQDSETRSFSLGIRVWEAGQAWINSLDLVRLAQPSLLLAREKLNETVQLAILDGVENVYVAKMESLHPVTLQSKVGSRLPAVATGLGKVLLSGLTDKEICSRFENYKFEAFTEKTIISLDQLLIAVQKIRKDGYSTDRGEYTLGVSCVAVPIYNHEAKICAAISVSVPEMLGRELDRLNVLEVLREGASEISKLLGAGSGNQS